MQDTQDEVVKGKLRSVTSSQQPDLWRRSPYDHDHVMNIP